MHFIFIRLYCIYESRQLPRHHNGPKKQMSARWVEAGVQIKEVFLMVMTDAPHPLSLRIHREDSGTRFCFPPIKPPHADSISSSTNTHKPSSVH